VSRRRRLAAALAVGVAAAAPAVARRRSRSGQVDGPVAPLPPLAGQERTVLTEDGVELAVVEHGGQDAPTATVLLVHGWVQSSRLWDGQVRDLLSARPDLRVVTYDHRGHGRSGPTPRDRATLQQLGRDLAVVVEAVAPDGPVLVVGHSMGGMTLMALAEERPELVAERVAGVALVGTSAADLQVGTYDLPAPVAALARRLLPAVGELGVRAERRGLPRYVGPLDRWLLFPRGAEPELVRQALDVHRESSAEVVAAFLPTLSDHDRRAALRALADVPAVVVVGDQDRLCPLAHSQALAAALPSSELTVFPGVGHMVHLERRPEVSAILLGLLDRALTRTG
jgi:pimeloyl-ACP methyl ester carboxylesterase